MPRQLFVLAFLSALVSLQPAEAALRVLVTVVDAKTFQPVEGLTAEDFLVLEDKTPRPVESLELQKGPVDIALAVDGSLVGETVRPVAASLVQLLGEKEQMALIAVHSSADLLQDFTSSKSSLLAALQQIKYGNDPRLLDGAYAAVEGGFSSSTFRKVVLLVTAGIEGPSRTTDKDLVRLARKNAVSIFPVFLHGSARGLFEGVARRTGGISFPVKDLQKTAGNDAPQRIFAALRGGYLLTLSGNLALSERASISIRNREKLQIGFVSLD